MKYYIEGKEVSVMEKIQHKLKQLNEALELVEDISDRCAWADDFANYGSIREMLDPVYSAAEQARDEIDDKINEIESQLQDMEERKKCSEVELEEEFKQNIQYCLD